MKGKIFRIKEEKEYEEKLNNEQNDSKLDLALSNQNQEDKTSNDKNIQDEDIIDEEIEKEKEKAKKIEEEKEAFKKVVKILKQDKEERTKDDNNLLKEYLSAHYKYFSDLLRQSEERFLKLIPVLKYESFKANERIVNFGEEGDKCYVLLKGTVGIYKPFPITKRMTLKQYVEYSKDECIYELIGLVTHYGESNAGGHFMARCKSPIDGNWYLYNDQNVTKIGREFDSGTKGLNRLAHNLCMVECQFG